MDLQILWAYEEYCADCWAEGDVPKGIEQWLYELNSEGDN